MPNAGDFLSDIAAQQHQSMLLRMLGNQNGTGAESLAGMAMSRGAAVGGPMASSALGMMGISPIGLGLMAGQAAWSLPGVGVAGALGAGMAVMGGASAVGAGVGLVGHQMMRGAQQQLGLNQNLHNNFNFMNQQGGMGFTSQQGFQIGDSIRSMTGVMGPSGEVSTFGELSRLSSEMGRMGMAQNVRTVKEFKEKFKQMVDTLKVVAHDLGTSLEEAQKAMASMKSSGVFRASDVTKMTGEMRVGALAGGLAMSEMSGAASIGSQISRSVGGLGRHGAFAGIKTMEMIGIAQRTGAINEEDIYNATGLTGAEGRQALAASQLQHSSSFLKTPRGRYFLASVASKDGQLDPESVAEWMAGGNVGTGRTREMANRNLSGIGRANFIRNEGRLRGAALGQFGGIVQSQVYKQWLADKKWDPSSMDDRAKIAFQNFSGMGRDEADVALKEVESIPEQLSAMENTRRDVVTSDALTRHRNKVGITGLKRKFDEIKEGIQGRLQTIGSRMLESATDQIESAFNVHMKVYEDLSTEGLSELGRMVEHRIVGGTSAGGVGAATRDYLRKVGNMNIGTGAGDALSSLGAMQSRVGVADKSMLALGGSTPEIAKSIIDVTLEHGGGSIESQISGFKKLFGKGSGVEWGDKARNVQVIENLQRGANVDPSGYISKKVAKETLDYNPAKSKYHTQHERDMALGELARGYGERSNEDRFKDKGELAQDVGNFAYWGTHYAGQLAKPFSFLYATARAGFESDGTEEGGNAAYLKAKSRVTTDAEIEDIAQTVRFSVADLASSVEERDTKAPMLGRARLLTGKDTMGTVAGLYGSDEDRAVADSQLNNMQQRMREGVAKDHTMSDLDLATFQGISELRTFAGNRDAFNRYGGEDGNLWMVKDEVAQYKRINPEDKSGDDAIARRIWKFGSIGGGAIEEQQGINRQKEQQRMMGDYVTDRALSLTAGYIDKDGKLVRTKKSREHLTDAQKIVVENAEKLLNFDPAKEGYGERQDEMAFQAGNIANLSIPEKLALARSDAGTPLGNEAAYQAQLEQRYTKDSSGVGGSIGAVAKRLGLSGLDDFLKGTSVKTQESREAAVKKLLGGMGVDTTTAEGKQFATNVAGAINPELAGGGKRGAGAQAHALEAALKDAQGDVAKQLQAAQTQRDEASNILLKPLNTMVGILESIRDKPAAGSPEGAPGTPNKPTPLVGCLSGSTAVSTSSGSMPIAALVATQADVEVRTGKSVPTTTKSYGMHDLLEVVLSDGQVFHATKWHPWPCLRDGVETPGCFTPELVGAQMYNGDLTPGPLVLSVLPTGRVEEVFCCKVEAPSHTFVIGNNILTGSA